MPEAVIVATARSPIGRAFKGSLTDDPPRRPGRPDGRARCSTRCRSSPPDQIEDLMMGCGQPAGEQGFNVARVVAVLAGLGHVPGVTVNRYCSSSLQTIRMAAHAIKAGEGDVFIAAGVECVSRYGARGVRHARRRQPDSSTRPASARAERAARRPAAVDAARRACPTSTSPWARRPRTFGSSKGVTREEMDEFAALLSQERAVASDRERVLRAGDHAGDAARRHGRQPRTTGRARAPRSRSWPQLKPVFRPDGEVTAGNACPLNDGAAAVVVMSDTKARAARHHAAGAESWRRACRRSTPRSWGSARSRPAARRWSGPASRSTTSIWSRSTRPSPPRCCPSAKHLGIPMGQAQRPRRRHRPRSPVRHDRRPHHGHPAQRARVHRRPLPAWRRMCVGGGQGMAMVVERLS